MRILSRAVATRPRVPAEWRDENLGLTLVGIGLVNCMGRPIYVERCSVSFHRLGITRPDAQARIIDFELIADRLSRDAEERNPDRDGLTEYLKANAQRVLLEDLYVLMQT